MFDDIDALGHLMRRAPAVPLTDSVHVARDRVAPILDRLRRELVPLGQELSDYRELYPDV